MKFDFLYSFGCSMSSGCELFTENIVLQKEDINRDFICSSNKNLKKNGYIEYSLFNENNSYPKLVANHFNSEFIDKANPGSSNNSIIFDVIETLEQIEKQKINKNNILFIIGITEIYRRPLVTKEKIKDFILKKDLYNKINDNFLKLLIYYSNIERLNYYLNSLLIHCLDFKQIYTLLNMNNIKFIFINNYNNIYIYGFKNSDINNKKYKDYFDNIRLSKYYKYLLLIRDVISDLNSGDGVKNIIEDISYSSFDYYVTINNLKRLVFRHPGLVANKKWSEIVIEKIYKKYGN